MEAFFPVLFHDHEPVSNKSKQNTFNANLLDHVLNWSDDTFVIRIYIFGIGIGNGIKKF